MDPSFKNLMNGGQSAMLVSLAEALAGEDLVNDRSKVSPETAQLLTPTQSSVSLATTIASNSAAIDCSNFRKFTVMGYGGTGPIKLLLQMSPDGGTTWFWHPNGETSTTQFPSQIGDIAAPLCRLVVTNTHTATQNVWAWVCLNR